MARILRGDIRWAELDPTRGHEQAGTRPVLVLSADVFNERSGTVIAVVLTSQEPRAGYPLTLESHASGLPKRSWIKIGQIRTLSTERLGKRVARAADDEVEQVIDGLNEIMGSRRSALGA
jgi:mRNA interferase MazF